ncbi:unnamed protein product [Oncorhynchus mykiss]|uniref:T-complex protein 1 subunit theta n=1 Tax=Oncorhynchus mykiss TaxID=8022 RepID=A0A060YSQ6_ONCMY|nr:unnamed protein product [Oncorhynchus mykiss]
MNVSCASSKSKLKRTIPMSPPQTPPTPEEMGHCDSVYLDEVGDTQVVVFKHEKEDGAISTLVIRGSTDNRMDDIERAIDDGVNTFKVLVRDKRLVPGAGATEIELARQITSYGESCPGLEQYAIKKFAEAFEAVPRALAENSGIKGNELISKLYAVHHEGNKNMGFDIEGEGAALKDMLEAGILEPFLVKHWGIKLATNAAITVLRVDQIIMAKPAGGPKAPTGKKTGMKMTEHDLYPFDHLTPCHYAPPPQPSPTWFFYVLFKVQSVWRIV